MNIVKISDTIKAEIPDDFEPATLPYFKEWVDALESGNFLQGNSYLQSGDHSHYCCLGVLCKLQGRLTNAGHDGFHGTNYSLSHENPCYSNLRSEGSFPLRVKVYYEDVEVRTLAILNDHGVSFADIVKVIRVFWKE